MFINTLKRILVLALFISVIAVVTGCGDSDDGKSVTQPDLGYRNSTILDVDGFQFKDLNKNGVLDAYEDWRLPAEDRVSNLLSLMSIEEKAGLFCAPQTSMGGTLEAVIDTYKTLTEQNLRTRIIGMSNFKPNVRAQANNLIQEMGEESRLGIPWLNMSDPTLAAGADYGQGSTVGEGAGGMADFSIWPAKLSSTSAYDVEHVRKWAKASHEAWLAIGVRVFLGPQIDLPTEPRWGRNTSTFGTDVEMASAMTAEWIKVFQPNGKELGKDAIVCVMKHWPGEGPQEGGYDGHVAAGKWAIYPGNNFDYHLKPFIAGFEAGGISCMTYYPIPASGNWTAADGVIDGRTIEQVGAGFNAELMTKMWKEHYGYDYTWFVSDWMIFENSPLVDPSVFMGACHGTEVLTHEQRVAKSILAGLNIFGGTEDPSWFVGAYNEGLVAEEDINYTVGRTLEIMFKLGLFENPYVDENAAAEAFAKQEYWDQGAAAMAKSQVLIKNKENLVPLDEGKKIFLYGSDFRSSDEGADVNSQILDVAEDYGDVINDNDEYGSDDEKIIAADYVILRITSPKWYSAMAPFPLSRDEVQYSQYINHNGVKCYNYDNTLGAVDHVVEVLNTAGNPNNTKVIVQASISTVVITEITALSDACAVDFGGIPDRYVFNNLFGRSHYSGKLPVGLPDSDDLVQNGYADIPDDDSVIYRRGYGLTTSAK